MLKIMWIRSIFEASTFHRYLYSFIFYSQSKKPLIKEEGTGDCGKSSRNLTNVFDTVDDRGDTEDKKETIGMYLYHQA